MTLNNFWEQLKAFKKIIKNFRRRAILILIFILCAPIFLTLQDYKNKQGVAFLIYPELINNIRTLDNIIDKNDKGEYFYSLGNKFAQKDYEKFYKYFGIPKIDIQLKNFYFNLNNNSRMYKKNDLLGIKSQGKQVAKLLSYYFGCRDWYESQKNIKEINIASADTVISTFSPIRYWEFINIGWKVYIVLVSIFLPTLWFIFYKKIYSWSTG